VRQHGAGDGLERDRPTGGENRGKTADLTGEGGGSILRGIPEGEQSLLMRILAVDDEPEYLEMLQEVMKSLGHSITTAARGEDALAILDRQSMDVIIADVKMPGMSGIELHAAVRSRAAYRNTPFIFLTGHETGEDLKRAMVADCDLLLRKPFPVERLLRLFSGQTRP
jgi:CheY-like chemotaxis protein